MVSILPYHCNSHVEEGGEKHMKAITARITTSQVLLTIRCKEGLGIKHETEQHTSHKLPTYFKGNSSEEILESTKNKSITYQYFSYPLSKPNKTKQLNPPGHLQTILELGFLYKISEVHFHSFTRPHNKLVNSFSFVLLTSLLQVSNACL